MLLDPQVKWGQLGGGEGEVSLTPWGYLTPRKKIASKFLDQVSNERKTHGLV